MGRKLFLAHLADATCRFDDDIRDIRSLDEGIVGFTYNYPSKDVQPVHVQACATDLGEYPDGNSFVLCIEDDSCHHALPRTLQRLAECAHGKSLVDLLIHISEGLTAALSTETWTEDSPEEQHQDIGEFDFDFEEDSDSEFFGPNTHKPTSSKIPQEFFLDSDNTSGLDLEEMPRIRTDLVALKSAGFRVGVFGNLASSGVLSASIRISKLGLSDEALQAWNIPRNRYLVLLIRYTQGYCDATRVSHEKEMSSLIQTRVGLCTHYKPSLPSVRAVFQQPSPETVSSHEQHDCAIKGDRAFELLFIGKSLNQFLEERFPRIISARDLYGLSWLGAEKLISDRQASASTAVIANMEEYHCKDVNVLQLPPIVHADHLDHTPLSRASLPLVLMQFVLRHVVRCTEFCLVCHCRVDDSFQALKPYVCLKPLCLFQYLALGFGPSLEWEIRTQPYVVDLLVSFCYAAAHCDGLKELPRGMNLMVPVWPGSQAAPPPRFGFHPNHGMATIPDKPVRAEKSFSSIWNVGKHTLVISKDTPQPTSRSTESTETPASVDSSRTLKRLKSGDWIVLVTTDITAHCRVKKVEHEQISIFPPVFIPKDEKDTRATSDILNMKENLDTDCYLYDKQFDDLPQHAQNLAIMRLLDTLPGVLDMRKFLEQQGWAREIGLKAWADRVSDSALSLLGWIVASNRSCILHVDDVGAQDQLSTCRLADRVGGMDTWMQFQFAQGAPDKEKRFEECVQEQARLTRTDYPTIFAWHGSRIGNWHSIIRQGLRYDEIVNGRAYGNGIYMSNDASTSLGYSHDHLYGSATAVGLWRPSALKIQNVLSLQEVVNNPKRFVSHQPHYVVADIEWVQTRYLLIKAKDSPTSQDISIAVYEQDPKRLVFNEGRKAISIPITAISKTRRSGTLQIDSSHIEKRKKTEHKATVAATEQEDIDGDSVISDAEDLGYFEDQSTSYDLILRGSQGQTDSGKKRPAEITRETDFVAGDLNLEGIIFMQPPQDATAIATKALMRLLKEALSTQENTAPGNLGWYIDRNLVNNMYQWIVELHSFPPDLPLAKDMKAAGLTSVVMEMRFTAQYPFSPPFIRVVKPRFKPFGQGGGGNVTDGGAMCMEVLTNNGWSAGLTIESLLLQVRLVLMDTERPARLASHSRQSGLNTYGIGEAMAAYIRACAAHGWTVPAGFKTMQQGITGMGG